MEQNGEAENGQRMMDAGRWNSQASTASVERQAMWQETL